VSSLSNARFEETRQVEEERSVPKPEGKLTPVQFEIMQLIWNAEQGLTIGEIWDAIRSGRDVSRTTVLNLVDRLEKRGWLKRRKQQGVFRYTASVERQSVETQLASDFVDEFFDGSAANLMMNLLGSQRISKSEIQRLKRLLDDRASASTRNKGESP
jgi:BlaI family penicillinase repressor